MSTLFRILNECASTNDDAKKWAAQGAPHGAWVLAHRQTAGRGRLGRAWQSLDGNLFLSVVLRVEPFPGLTWLPLLSAVAAVEALEHEAPAVKLQIKWPNDIWSSTAKMGGILCESSAGVAVVGLGVNLSRVPISKDLSYAASALAEFTGKTHRPEELAPKLAQRIVRHLEVLIRSGPEAVRQSYELRARLRTGSRVQWNSGASSGRVVALGGAGQLRVQTDAGEIELFAEDVSLSS